MTGIIRPLGAVASTSLVAAVGGVALSPGTASAHGVGDCSDNRVCYFSAIDGNGNGSGSFTERTGNWTPTDLRLHAWDHSHGAGDMDNLIEFVWNRTGSHIGLYSGYNHTNFIQCIGPGKKVNLTNQNLGNIVSSIRPLAVSQC